LDKQQIGVEKHEKRSKPQKEADVSKNAITATLQKI
jgi:hypothetical protein